MILQRPFLIGNRALTDTFTYEILRGKSLNSFWRVIQAREIQPLREDIERVIVRI